MTDFEIALAARPTDPKDQAAARARFRRRLYRDRCIGECAVRMAGLIESVFLNTDSGIAWPGYTRLAEEIGCDRKTITRSINSLVSRGHLVVQSGDATTTNAYTLPWNHLLTDDDARGTHAPRGADDARGTHVPRVGAPVSGGRGTGVPEVGAPTPLKPVEDNWLIEPIDEPVEAAPTKAPAANKQSASKRRSQIPKDWQPTKADIAFAIAKGFAVEDVGNMADEFHSYWRGDGGVKADWSSTWRNSVIKKAAWRRERPAGKKPRSVLADYAELAGEYEVRGPQDDVDAVAEVAAAIRRSRQ